MISSIKGKIVDENNQPIPSATVYLSDAKGALVNSKARVIADLDGNYTLPFAIPMPNLATGGVMKLPIAKYITAKYTGYPDKTVALPEKFISDTGVGSLNIPLTLKSQQIQEVEVQANKNAVECARLGGFYNAEKNTCTLPPKLNQPQKEIPMKPLPKPSWWKKNWWWVVGLGVVAIGTTIFIISKNKKKKI